MTVSQQPGARPGSQRAFISFNHSAVDPSDLKDLLTQLREDLAPLFTLSDDSVAVKERDTLPKSQQSEYFGNGDTHYVDIQVGPLRNSPGEPSTTAFWSIVEKFSRDLVTAQQNFEALLF
ncbi:MAG TPA: hypothetical protein PKB15_02340 [Acidimicrobiia bacterium]|nr:hypothetical protein [Acidimicrobiia bacterium]